MRAKKRCCGNILAWPSFNRFLDSNDWMRMEDSCRMGQSIPSSFGKREFSEASKDPNLSNHVFFFKALFFPNHLLLQNFGTYIRKSTKTDSVLQAFSWQIRLGRPPSSRFWRYHSEGTGWVPWMVAIGDAQYQPLSVRWLRLRLHC